MLFNSLEFAIFLPIVYALYLMMGRLWQNRMLLVASYIFYAAWNWKFLSLILFSTALDYCCASHIDQSDNEKSRKRWVTLSIVGNISVLCFFKYFHFFIDNMEILVTQLGFQFHQPVWRVILPIGISFYTFQTMSYTIDVYRKKIKPAKLLDFSLFVAFFPQLIAGPIERATRILPQLQKPRILSLQQFYKGCHFIFWGLFLKVFVADNLAGLVDPLFASSAPYNGASILISVYAFAFQVYGDFAGYSFMAIGIGRIMGISIMQNFNRPYLSEDISVFWRRWHISLSSWFRDYVFTPFYIYTEKKPWLSKLSLKVRHQIAFLIALLVAEILLGFWHGAGWQFGLFGLYHGILIFLFYSFRSQWNIMPAWLRIVLTFHLVCLGWLIFRSTSLSQLGDMLNGLFLNFHWMGAMDIQNALLTLVFYLWILLAVEGYQHFKDDLEVLLKVPHGWRVLFYSVCFMFILIYGVNEGRVFIYFAF
jgi:alginate O-acetyltransferase complex protein AlgI